MNDLYQILAVILVIIYFECCSIIGEEISGNKRAFIALLYILLFNLIVLCVLAVKW